MRTIAFRAAPLAALGCLLSVILLPASALAADVCCSCNYSNGSTSNTFCLTADETVLPNPEDCASLPSASELGEGWTCTKKISDAQCKSIAYGGICKTDPQSVAAAKGSVSAAAGDVISNANSNAADPALLMNFNTPIPGYVAPENPNLQFGAYVSAIYRYGISITAIAATIMFIWGAFLYLVGSSTGNISKGKSIMTDAVIGMVLIFSANLILRTLNPALVEFRDLSDITGIKTELYLDKYAPGSMVSDCTLPAGIAYSKTNVAEGIIQGAKRAGVDPCLVLAICEHETGLRPLWNGCLAKLPKEQAIAFGPCQIVAKYLNSSNPIARATKSTFSDFPLSQSSGALSNSERMAVGDWLLSNPAGSGYIAGLLLKSNINIANGNELTAIAAYGAGSGSMGKWAQAHSCQPTANQTIASGATSLEQACIPHSVAISTYGEAPKGCPEDGYECLDAKADASASFVGHCSDGRKCYAMITDSFVKYVISAYARLQSTYSCSSR